jgi:coproporphyrinogen III oxidase-like Fe-S oxidoreductase
LIELLHPKIEPNGRFIVTFMNANTLKNQHGELNLTHMNKPMFCVRFFEENYIEVYIATIGKWHREILVDPYKLIEQFKCNGLILTEMVPLTELHSRVASVKLSKQESMIADLYCCAMFQKIGK